MPINFDILKSQPQVGGVVATIPQRPNGLDQLAGGLIEGAKAGTDIANANSQMAQRDQEMQQSKQLFPLKQQAAQQEVASGAIDLSEKQAAQSQAQKIRDTAFKSSDDYFQKLLQIDPVKAYAFKKGTTDIENTLADVALKQANTKKEAQNVVGATSIALANIADSAHQADASKPGSGAQVYKMLFSQLEPGTQKNLTEVGLGEWNDNTNVILHIQGQKAAADAAEANAKKGASSQVKTASEMARIKLAQQAGTATEQDNQTLAQLEADKKASNARGNPTDIAIGQADAENLKKIQAANKAIPRTLEAVNNAEAELTKIPGQLLNPLMGATGLSRLSPNVQVLVSNLNKLTLANKESFNMGSQGFTDADRKFVSDITGNLSNYKGTLKELLAQSKSVAQHMAIEGWINESEIQQKSSDQGQQWMKNNPEPTAQIKDKDGQVWDIPASKLREAQKRGGVLQ